MISETNRVIYSAIPADSIILDKNEISARLQARGDILSHGIMKDCYRELVQAMQCKYAAIRVPVKYPNKNEVNFGFGVISSKALFANLKGVDEAFIFAVTLGIGVDRLLMRQSLVSQSKHFITDALASAAAEAACDIADSIIKDGLKCRPRFSPGYADLAIETQPQFLSILNAQKLLGITLNKSFLMTPVKSITAIMGICNEE